jgi:hypothetical protein
MNNVTMEFYLQRWRLTQTSARHGKPLISYAFETGMATTEWMSLY